MKNIVLILISFILCAFLGVVRGWAWFFPVYLLFSYKNLDSSLVWEIPLWCYGTSILILFMPDLCFEIFRILLPCAALLIALTKPKKMLIFFPIAMLMLFLKNDEAGIYTMMASIIYSFHKLYHKTESFTSVISR